MSTRLSHFKNKEYLISLITGILLLVLSIFVLWYAGLYAAEKASSSVTDIVLSNIRVYDVDEIFIYAPILFWLIVAIYCFNRPNRIPFALKAIALFVLIRSLFISLTHIGPFPDRLIAESPSALLTLFDSGSDLFFSGHTGLPFLMALVLWNEKYMRIFCVLSAIFFGAIVLLGHLHYTIDVLAAFFITYSIYKLAEKLWPKDHALFHQKY